MKAVYFSWAVLSLPQLVCSGLFLCLAILILTSMSNSKRKLLVSHLELRRRIVRVSRATSCYARRPFVCRDRVRPFSQHSFLSQTAKVAHAVTLHQRIPVYSQFDLSMSGALCTPTSLPRSRRKQTKSFTFFARIFTNFRLFRDTKENDEYGALSSEIRNPLYVRLRTKCFSISQ